MPRKFLQWYFIIFPDETHKLQQASVLPERTHASCEANNEHDTASDDHHQGNVEYYVVHILHPDRSRRVPFVHKRVQSYPNQESAKQLQTMHKTVTMFIWEIWLSKHVIFKYKVYMFAFRMVWKYLNFIFNIFLMFVLRRWRCWRWYEDDSKKAKIFVASSTY